LKACACAPKEGRYKFLKIGRPMDEMSFEAGIGRARAIAIRDPESIKTKELERHGIRAGEPPQPVRKR